MQDNNNRAGAWVAKRLIADVKGMLNGEIIYGLAAQTGHDTPKPKYELWLRDANGSIVGRAAIFAEAKFENQKGGGQLTTRNHGDFFVTLWGNNSDNPKAPQLSLTFKPKDARPPAAPEDEGEAYDTSDLADVPF